MKELKIISICIILSSFSFLLQSQSDLINKFESYGNDNAALKESLRLYYNEEGSTNDLIALKIARLFAKTGDYNNAKKYYDIQYRLLSYDDTLKNNIRYEKIALALVNQDYTSAKLEVLQISKKNISDWNKYYFHKGMIFLFNNNFEKGIAHLSNLDYLSASSIQEITTHTERITKIGDRKIGIYQIASGVIPGTGQFIAGDIKGGINSMAVVGGFTYLFFNVADRLSYSDAAISVGPWLVRYFIGGVGNAREAAKLKKVKQINARYEKILKTIEHDYLLAKSL